jgi:putative acetyltransferase
MPAAAPAVPVSAPSTPSVARTFGPWTIRRATADDAPGVAAVNSDPAVVSGTLQLPYPDVERLRKRFAEGSADDLHLVALRDGVIVGAAGLFSVSAAQRRRHARGLGIGLAPSAQGQGLGRLLMSELVHYADRWGPVLRIELTVFTDNARAIALYQRFGFRVEGTHVAYALRDGVYADVYAMARLHPNPPGIAWPQP